MSAELLRRAASVMRERAEAATPGPWGYYGHSIIRPAELKDGKAPSYSAAYHKEDAEHIASWHPDMALAMADWLETCANLSESGDDGGPTMRSHAVNVARVYLGDPW